MRYFLTSHHNPRQMLSQSWMQAACQPCIHLSDILHPPILCCTQPYPAHFQLVSRSQLLPATTAPRHRHCCHFLPYLYAAFRPSAPSLITIMWFEAHTSCTTAPVQVLYSPSNSIVTSGSLVALTLSTPFISSAILPDLIFAASAFKTALFRKTRSCAVLVSSTPSLSTPRSSGAHH